VIVRTTGEGRRVAKYHPNLTDIIVEQLEMECVQGQGNEIVPHPKPNVRMFWRELPNLRHPVGASLGHETFFMYVEWNSSGPVHGRPITCAELISKGAVL
jgi:hypothetical protein